MCVRSTHPDSDDSLGLSIHLSHRRAACYGLRSFRCTMRHIVLVVMLRLDYNSRRFLRPTRKLLHHPAWAFVRDVISSSTLTRPAALSFQLPAKHASA